MHLVTYPCAGTSMVNFPVPCTYTSIFYLWYSLHRYIYDSFILFLVMAHLCLIYFIPIAGISMVIYPIPCIGKSIFHLPYSWHSYIYISFTLFPA